jgi:acyl carrier protein
MNRTEILDALHPLFSSTLDDEPVSLHENTTADEVEGWDSLTHVQLVVAIEKHFKIKFSAKEIQSWKNVGELIDSISGKI